ncbi:UNVERIFIED_CONTAM: hypothetical protein RMT77_008765 [Armadillidium vulgare]
MFKLTTSSLLAIVLLCLNITTAENITKQECKNLGGSYCPQDSECYFTLDEEVKSYKEAAELCATKKGVLPQLNMEDYNYFLNCTFFTWGFPFTAFFQSFHQNPDECVCMTLVDVSEFTILNRCEINTTAKVVCEAPFYRKKY